MKFDLRSVGLANSLLAVVAEVVVSASEKTNTAKNHLQHPFSTSVLQEKPELFAAYFPQYANAGSKLQVVPLSRKYKAADGYESLDFGDTSASLMAAFAEAKQILSEFSKKKQQQHGDNPNRQLIPNGHLIELIKRGCDAEQVYQHTTYDDHYQPFCQCLEDLPTGLHWMECYLGDETCTRSETTNTTDDDVCSETYELFVFRDSDGDLESKGTCTICNSRNCDGIEEICTTVYFDNDDKPFSCELFEFLTPGGDLIQCDDCNICNIGVDTDIFGVQHTCFDNVTTECNTETYALVHNLEAGPAPHGIPIPGVFGDLCASDTVENDLYDGVTYDSGFSKLCDCDDPTSGVINCDLYDDACFANLCTKISDTFFFVDTTGNYDSKSTINWDTLLWTYTFFDYTTGLATDCSVFDSDPDTGEVLRCNNCEICETTQDGPGIMLDCFGRQQACDASDGRAEYNFALPLSTTAPLSVMPSSSGSIAPSLEPSQDDNGCGELFSQCETDDDCCDFGKCETRFLGPPLIKICSLQFVRARAKHTAGDLNRGGAAARAKVGATN